MAEREVERVAKLLWSAFVRAGVWGPSVDWGSATAAERRPFRAMARAVIRDCARKPEVPSAR